MTCPSATNAETYNEAHTCRDTEGKTGRLRNDNLLKPESPIRNDAFAEHDIELFNVGPLKLALLVAPIQS